MIHDSNNTILCYNSGMTEIRTLSPNEYPLSLCEIPEPPKTLSIIGKLPSEDTLWLAVVGSRRFTSYGKEVCEKIIGELAGENIVIVSGLALGIDAIAHHVALDAGLTTVAIPGSGLDEAVLYPRTHLAQAPRQSQCF